MAHISVKEVDIIQPALDKEPCTDKHLVFGTARWRRCRKCGALVWVKALG